MYQLVKTLLIGVLTLSMVGCGPSKLKKLHIDLYLDQPLGADANERLSASLVGLLEPYVCGDTGYRVILRIIRIDMPEKSGIDTIEVPRSKEDEWRLHNFTGFDAYTYDNLERGYDSGMDTLTMGQFLTARPSKAINLNAPSIDTTRTKLFVSMATGIEGLEVDSLRGIVEKEYCSKGRMRKISIVLRSNTDPDDDEVPITSLQPEEGDTVNVGGIAGIYVKKMGSTYSTENHPVDLLMLDPLPNQYYLVTNTYKQPGISESNSSFGLRQLIAAGFVNARVLRVSSSEFKTILVSSANLDAIRGERDEYKRKYPDITIETVSGGRVKSGY